MPGEKWRGLDASSPRSDVFNGLIIAVDLLSLAACLWLACRVLRLPPSHRKRLFPRQVLLLAASDACLAISTGLIPALVYLSGKQQPHHPGPLLLEVAMFWTFHATLLSEFHIVVGFACQLFGSPKLRRCFGLTVWLPWFLAALLTLQLTCGFYADWTRGANIAVCACFAVSLLTFAAIICRARRCNTALARRSWRRASVYVLNFIVTFGPFVLANDSHRDAHWLFGFLGFLGLHANGLVNAATYFAQSRYAQGPPRCEEAHRAAQSLVVRFAEPTPEAAGDAHASRCGARCGLCRGLAALCSPAASVGDSIYSEDSPEDPYECSGLF